MRARARLEQQLNDRGVVAADGTVNRRRVKLGRAAVDEGNAIVARLRGVDALEEEAHLEEAHRGDVAVARGMHERRRTGRAVWRVNVGATLAVKDGPEQPLVTQHRRHNRQADRVALLGEAAKLPVGAECARPVGHRLRAAQTVGTRRRVRAFRADSGQVGTRSVPGPRQLEARHEWRLLCGGKDLGLERPVQRHELPLVERGKVLQLDAPHVTEDARAERPVAVIREVAAADRAAPRVCPERPKVGKLFHRELWVLGEDERIHRVDREEVSPLLQSAPAAAAPGLQVARLPRVDVRRRGSAHDQEGGALQVVGDRLDREELFALWRVLAARREVLDGELRDREEVPPDVRALDDLGEALGRQLLLRRRQVVLQLLDNHLGRVHSGREALPVLLGEELEHAPFEDGAQHLLQRTELHVVRAVRVLEAEPLVRQKDHDPILWHMKRLALLDHLLVRLEAVEL
eukprot:scaffold51616_cov67-Phaeocystis_antarctica.AAC.1